MQAIHQLNADKKVHGILVQLPLPSGMDERRVINEITKEKDVDGFHPANVGLTTMRGHEPDNVACTAMVRSV